MSRTRHFDPEIEEALVKLRPLRLQGGQPHLSFGEVYWVERDGWKACDGFYTNESREHHPGLVLQAVYSYRPAIMAPGTSRPTDARSIDVFVPRKPVIDGHDKLSHFILTYQRPVQRRYVENDHGPVGILDCYERAELEIKLWDLYAAAQELDSEPEA